jgi:PTS system beta-glucosides-specific IIC component/PTS system sucrose-specific IIC component
MNYKKIANDILHLLGGKGNISSAAHCATRLRLVLNDDSIVSKEKLEEMPEVKGCFNSSGQFQIILGQGVVNKVYAEMTQGAEIKAVSTSDAKKDAMKNMNIVQRAARTLSNIFVPIIPAIVASGLLMGLLGMGSRFGWFDSSSSIFSLLDMFSNAAFVFLPILIAFSAAKEFGCNPYLAAVLGGILIHPALQNAWTVGGGISGYIELFGMKIAKVGYQGTVLPILIAVWIMSYVEKNIRKVIPNSLDLILTPFFTILATGFISLFLIGPAGRALGNGISFSLDKVLNIAGPVAGLIFGGLYSSIVITGVHHSFHAFEAEMIKNIGGNYLLPIWSMANVAQGGAAFAVFFKTKDTKIKSIALPSATSCLLGITEAAIFGVNLKLVRPFISAAIGGAAGGAYVVLTKVYMTGVGVTAIPGTAIVANNCMLNYLIGFAIAFGIAFGLTYVAGFKEESKEESNENKKTEETVKAEEKIVEIYSPLSGAVVELSDTPDEAFAEKMLGDGVAIIPKGNMIQAPCDAEEIGIFDTNHAVSFETNGLELIVHFGIDTVKLDGKGFERIAANESAVKKGDHLVKFDLDFIKENAKSTTTPVIIANMDDIEIIERASGDIEAGDLLMKVRVL